MCTSLFPAGNTVHVLRINNSSYLKLNYALCLVIYVAINVSNSNRLFLWKRIWSTALTNTNYSLYNNQHHQISVRLIVRKLADHL